ncbi:MAG: hypothetical protein FGM37_00265 [Phycisphaerales bacterium]|nr:hypothetical protein [Phycisphaerales bacterium]
MRPASAQRAGTSAPARTPRDAASSRAAPAPAPASAKTDAPAARASAAEPVAATAPAAPRATAPRAAAPAAAPRVTATAGDSGANWGITLATFTGDGHRQAAEQARASIARQYIELSDTYVRSNSSGSVVMVGRFTGLDDPAAKPRVKAVQEIQDARGGRPFARAILSRLEGSRRAGPLSPSDLRSARAMKPGNSTLYTLQVALWSDFGSGEVSPEEIRRSAEGYCARLRSQGHAAFYYHDEDRRMSIVTVGVFGPEAYDARTTLFSPEVDELMAKFPAMLVAGEELLVRTDPRDPSSKMLPQRPMLVEVPR